MKNDENMKKQRETQQTNDEHIEKTMKNDEHIEKTMKQKIHAKNIGKNHETAATAVSRFGICLLQSALVLVPPATLRSVARSFCPIIRIQK